MGFAVKTTYQDGSIGEHGPFLNREAAEEAIENFEERAHRYNERLMKCDIEEINCNTLPGPKAHFEGSLLNPTFYHLEKLGVKAKRVVSFCEVLYSGWECDPFVWLIEDVEGKGHILTTDHGSFKIEKSAWLQERMDFYLKVHQETGKILDGFSDMNGTACKHCGSSSSHEVCPCPVDFGEHSA